MTDEFIAHHGIKGQRWGVRRTAEQLGHYAKPIIQRSASESKKTFVKSTTQQTAQAISNSMYGVPSKKKKASETAKQIARNAAIAATTTLLATAITSIGSDAVAAGVKYAKPYVKAAFSYVTDPSSSIGRDAIDVLLARYYGFY